MLAVDDTLGEWGWLWLVPSSLVVLFIVSSCRHPWLPSRGFSKANSSSLAAHKGPSANQVPEKLRTLRVAEIPIGKPLECLVEDLMFIAKEDTKLLETLGKLRRKTLARRTCSTACATIEVLTPLSADDLVQRLQKADGESKYRYDCNFHGITPLHEGDGHIDVDIIAVPGLASHAVGSWTHSEYGDFWLRDYLPKDFPNTRVLLYGYDTKLTSSKSKDSVSDMGNDFLKQLKETREATQTSHRPIIFIAHSLGGLVIKEALIRADKERSDKISHGIAQACFGLLMFGVPNLGLRNDILQSIVKGQPNENMIRDLVINSDGEPSAFLGKISEDFARRFGDLYRTSCFYETQRSPTVKMLPNGKLDKSGPAVLMVTKTSAVSVGATSPYCTDCVALHADHSSLVKYGIRSRGAYQIVRLRIGNFLEEAKIEGVPDFPSRRSIFITKGSASRSRLRERVNDACYS